MTRAADPAVLAVDIGGTKINAAVVVRGTVGPVASGPTPAADGGSAVIAQVISVAREAHTQARAQNLLTAGVDIGAVGVASAGVIDSATGSVRAATDAIRGWTGTHIAAPLRAEFEVPVRVLNDVHAHGLGEAVYGAGKSEASLLLVAVGTGVGGAFVTRTDNGDHEVSVGVHGAAGHVGHVPVPEAQGVVCSCGRTGHLEGYASGPGIAAELTRRGVRAASTKEVAQLANDPDDPRGALALEVMRTAGFATGRVIGGLLNVLDPGVVALTGGVSTASGFAGETWWEGLRAGAAHEAMDITHTTPILPAYAGNYAALLGAAAFARRSHSSSV